MPNSDNSIYFYKPNFPLTVVATVLFFWPTTILVYRTCQHKTWYLVLVPIAGILEGAGYIARSLSVKSPSEVSKYATSTSLIVVAPLFLAANNYLVLGRLLLCVMPSTASTPIPRIFRISATKLTKIFVGCDIISFLIQVSGSGIASSNNWQGRTTNIGVNILIVGLATQLATMLIFLSILARFGQRTGRKDEVRQNAPAEWKKVFVAVIASCVFIVIRSIYRLIEFSLGVGGYPFSHEWPFYMFECLPMLPAIAIFCVWYPGRILPKKKGGGEGEGAVEMQNAIPKSH